MSNYRSRLSELEKDINKSRESSMGLKINFMYIIIIALWLLILVLWTPSFLYLPKQKKAPRKKAWMYMHYIF